MIYEQKKDCYTIKKTSAKGIIFKAGRYGGTFTHKDIAFEIGLIEDW